VRHSALWTHRIDRLDFNSNVFDNRGFTLVAPEINNIIYILFMLCLLFMAGVLMLISVVFFFIDLYSNSTKAAKASACLSAIAGGLVGVMYYTGLPPGGSVRMFMPHAMLVSVLILVLSATRAMKL